MFLLGCFVAQTRGVMLYYLTSNGSRVGDNVVFVREPGNLFDPSCVKDSCVYVFLSFTGQSCVYYKSVKGLCSNNQSKCSVFAYYTNITSYL